MASKDNADERLCRRKNRGSTNTVTPCKTKCFCRTNEFASSTIKHTVQSELPEEKLAFLIFRTLLKRFLKQYFVKSEIFKENVLSDTDKTRPKFRRTSTLSNLYIFYFFITCFSASLATVSSYGREGNPPRVVTSEATILSAYRGQTLTLPCMVSGDPFPLTVWWKDGLQVSREWKRFKQQRTSLRIRNVELADEGLYHCEAVNGFGTKRVEIQLQVHEERQSRSFGRKQDTAKPIFSQPKKMRRHTVAKPLGGTVSFRCKAKGKPRPRIQWFKDGNLTGIPTSSGFIKPQWILTLNNIRSQDSGRYTCRVWNTQGEITFDYTLRVIGVSRHERPVLLKPHPVNTTVRAGEKASVQCRVRSVIPPTVKWIKRLDRESVALFNGNLPNNSLEINKKIYLILPPQEMMRLPDGTYLNKLVINHAQERDSGMYICLGANTMGYNFRYAYLTVNPTGEFSQRVEEKTLPLSIIIGVPAGVGLVLVFVVTMFCICKRDQMVMNPDNVSASLQNPRHPEGSGLLLAEASPLRTSTSRSEDAIISSTSQHLLDEQTPANAVVGSPYSSVTSDPYEAYVNSTNTLKKTSISDKNFPEQSESEAPSSFIRPPPPPPPSQYSRSSSTDAGSRHWSHHSCHRSSRHHHHHHHRYRPPPNSITSHSYCSNTQDY